MIQTHAANSAWWGQPVGLLTDATWFALDESVRARDLQPFAWVEFRSPLATAPGALVLQRAGFAWTDVQVPFRISLTNVADSSSLAPFECLAASQEPFRLSKGELRPFEQERFLQLPQVTIEGLESRYLRWANELIATHPQTCLRLRLDGRTQGWFLAEPQGGRLSLTLAMLAADAVASGQHLYQRALRELAQRGGSVGQAAFSIRNVAVLNIYAALGAKFTAPNGIWMWTNERLRDPLRPAGEGDYLTPSNSTTKTSVEFGGMAPG